MLPTAALLLAALAGAPSAAPLAASPASVARPALAPQPVKLVAKDKVELSGTYFPPKDMDAKNTAVLLVHDAGSDSASVAALAEAWNKRGAAVLSLDLRGHGESKAERVDWTTASEKEREVLWAMAKRDLEAGESYLRERTEVHSSRIVVAGKGAGAGLAVRYGIEGAGVAGVVLVDPPVEEEKTWGIDVAKGLAELEGLPALIVCCKETRKACDAMAEAAHEANDGYEYVELGILRSERKTLLEDKRLSSTLTGWTKEKVEGGN